jgi:hypothetical protein
LPSGSRKENIGAVGRSNHRLARSEAGFDLAFERFVLGLAPHHTVAIALPGISHTTERLTTDYI